MVLTWEAPKNSHDKHYQRFLYRVNLFRKAFQDWFVCDQPYTQHCGICDDRPQGHYKLNVPSKGEGSRFQLQSGVSAGLSGCLLTTRSLEISL